MVMALVTNGCTVNGIFFEKSWFAGVTNGLSLRSISKRKQFKSNNYEDEETYFCVFSRVLNTYSL